MSKYAGTDVFYCTNPGNGGDAFIAHATFQLFDELSIRYRAISYQDVVEGETVFYGGGGNLIEGIYPHAYEFLRNNSGRGNAIIVMPHSILGYQEFLKNAPDITLICRETVSYDALMAAGLSSERLFLSEDLAFHIDVDKLVERRQGVGTGYFLRGDIESAGKVPKPAGNMDLSMCWNGDLWDEPVFTEAVCRSILLHINRFESVRTDRLHVGIMSALLGKKVYLYPNSYYKVKAVYEHTLHRYSNVTLMEDFDEAPAPPDVHHDQISVPAVSEPADADSHGNPSHSWSPGLWRRLESGVRRLLDRKPDNG